MGFYYFFLAVQLVSFIMVGVMVVLAVAIGIRDIIKERRNKKDEV